MRVWWRWREVLFYHDKRDGKVIENWIEFRIRTHIFIKIEIGVKGYNLDSAVEVILRSLRMPFFCCSKLISPREATNQVEVVLFGRLHLPFSDIMECP